MVPYFKDWSDFNENEETGGYKDMDDYLFKVLDLLGEVPVGYENRTIDDNPLV